MMQFSKAVALRIRELMKERQLTQYASAKRSGISTSTLNTVLSGKLPGRIDTTMLNICRGLDIELADFYNTESLKRKNIADD